MQDGAVFREINPVTAEHRVDGRPQAGFLGQRNQQPERFVGDAVLRVIKVKADRLGGQALAAPGVGSEQFSQVQALDFPAMRSEGFPGLALDKWFHRSLHVCDLFIGSVQRPHAQTQSWRLRLAEICVTEA